ncbi:MAG TPA: response regulator transcription factor [Tissierellia bacterium]|nr:response regulator transcription factor [Tissierellia bacterium]
MMNILIVDDERLIVKGIKSSLEVQGYNVYTAYTGYEALDIISREKVDFIILDLMLPDIDGMMLCKKIRENNDTPIIMLTAKDGDYDKILGFELGADDYMTKPFNMLELIARIKAILRRSESNKSPSTIQFNDLVISHEERKVYVKGEEVNLTQKEFDMLYLMARNPGRVFTREEIFNHIWSEEPVDVRTIDVHIKNLREKIEENAKKPKFIMTKWGVGYYFNKS